MKKLSPFLILAILFTACQHKGASSAGTDSFTLTGKLTGLGNDTVFLMHRNSEGTFRDTIIAQNDSFSFTGKCPHPQVYSLAWFRSSEKKSRAFRVNYQIFLEPGNIKITGNVDSVGEGELTVTGSPSQAKYDEFLALVKTLGNKMDSLEILSRAAEIQKDKKAQEAIDTAYDLLTARRKVIAAHFIVKNPNSPVASFIALRELATENPDVNLLDSVYQVMDTAVQSDYYGAQLKELIASLKQTAVGQPAPNFTLNDTSGKPVSLDSYKGKVVLVDFWASWCGPCRRENPNVVKAYRKFHPKGLEILGVSLDEKHDKWVAAIARDMLGWQHVSDLKGWNNVVAKQYAVRSIPNNYLIDKDGKIIAKTLYGDNLTAKLEEVLK